MNQNTINFEQASSFIGNGKYPNNLSKRLFEEPSFLPRVSEENADMSDQIEEDDCEDDGNDSSSESKIMKSAKKSNIIRKKRKNGLLGTDLKKKNKMNIAQAHNSPTFVFETVSDSMSFHIAFAKQSEQNKDQ